MTTSKLAMAIATLFFSVVIGASDVRAEVSVVPERIMGNPGAPVTVEEFISLTCPHCGEFYTTVLPELEKRYVDTGKVRFILRDFPLDGVALKAAALARCMPAEQFYPFINILYSNLQQWVMNPAGPEKILMQYAKLGGLSDDKAQSCMKDTAMLDALVAGREKAADKYGIDATPSFVINGGKEKITGMKSVEEFSAVIDKLLPKTAGKEKAADKPVASNEKIGAETVSEMKKSGDKELIGGKSKASKDADKTDDTGNAGAAASDASSNGGGPTSDAKTDNAETPAEPKSGISGMFKNLFGDKN